MTYFLLSLPLVTIILVIALSAPEAPFALWLYKWATLLAGILAVAAALLTVNQMQKIDDQQARRVQESEERQQDRHAHNVRLTLRADSLRAERAAYPQATDMRQWLEYFEQVVKDYGPIIGGGLPPSEEEGRHIYDLADKITRIFDRPALEEAANLLESRSYYVYGTIMRDVRRLRTRMEEAESAVERSNDAALAVVSEDMMVDLTGMRSFVKEFAGTLISLDQFYKT
ncbi:MULTISPECIES: hypothetical protein [unclassified Mesorhizobium]|uniref:hypothetical protein n=1 Tax=unclassified Mesorhizobium TaxID=325217 RepID=UPI0012EBF6F7|nr:MULTISPECIES: hypothetical protein [unclassified Mesorhizobium]WJI81494.1 hypothetical protein NLY34_01655 [Mesorhizobium sp. C374B]WJI88013.1 hypothetical protein NLY42_04070 [Mesorhizobium sp. C372A]